jgi:hypothetical protein
MINSFLLFWFYNTRRYYAHIVIVSLLYRCVFDDSLTAIYGAINIIFDALYICEHGDMNTDTTSKGNRDSKGSKKDIDDNAAATGESVMDVGDTSRDIRDTGDVARASIAKGRGDQGGRTGADIAKGQIKSDESVIQGTAATATATATPNTAEDDNISKDKVVSSGTSLNEDKSIDKADIYSTEETGTRHLDRAQEKAVEKVEDKEKGSWRIKEGGEEET